MTIETVVAEFDAGRITREQAIAQLHDLCTRSLRDEVALIAFRYCLRQRMGLLDASSMAYDYADHFMAARGE